MDDAYREHAPHPRLSAFVACYWTSEGGTGAHPVLPDGCIDLLFDARAGRLDVVGTMTRAMWIDRRDAAQFVGVRFRPGGAVPFLRERADRLTDRAVHAPDVIGRRGVVLEERLGREPAVHVLEAFLLSRVAETTIDARVARAAAILTARPDRSVESVVHEIGVTRQHLRRLFLEHVGVSPKAFARTARLAKLVPLLARGRSLASAAFSAGYADQPHMTRELRGLVGVTPAQYLALPSESARR